MASSLLSPAAVNVHHHPNSSIFTAAVPLLPSIRFFSSSHCSGSKIVSSQPSSLHPPRSSNLWLRRCGASSPHPPSPPESGPPPGEDDDSNSGTLVLALLNCPVLSTNSAILHSYLGKIDDPFLHENPRSSVKSIVHWYLLVDFKKMFKFFLLFFSGCHSSSGHPLGMEGIMADPTRDQSSGNESVNM
uniref:Uncharacterized protein n=1 Tax=Lactuca sativa TaxID=4236 RepID=A0A9R1VTG5_LACSA|nr:hypothetical protein LSAT_V11C400192310 [Lactuca sativa]